MSATHRESEAAGDFYTNKRQPSHRFELVATDVIKGALCHSYFHTEDAVMRALAFLPPGAEWTVNRIIPTVGEGS